MKATRAEKMELLAVLVGEQGMGSIFLTKRGELLGADIYCRPYYFIDGDLDYVAYGRIVRSAKRRGFDTKKLCVIADGFEMYQAQGVRFHKANDLRRGFVY